MATAMINPKASLSSGAGSFISLEIVILLPMVAIFVITMEFGTSIEHDDIVVGNVSELPSNVYWVTTFWLRLEDEPDDEHVNVIESGLVADIRSCLIL
jgi:hypothetical protein